MAKTKKNVTSLYTETIEKKTYRIDITITKKTQIQYLVLMRLMPWMKFSLTSTKFYSVIIIVFKNFIKS